MNRSGVVLEQPEIQDKLQSNTEYILHRSENSNILAKLTVEFRGRQCSLF